MNVSLPFASPARKQDTTNNNKKGQPHDKWCPSETTASHEDLTARSKRQHGSKSTEKSTTRQQQLRITIQLVQPIAGYPA